MYVDILISLLSPRTEEEQHPLVDMNKSLTNETVPVCCKEVGKDDRLEQLAVAKSRPDRQRALKTNVDVFWNWS